jgi:pimeloyl-ACP methyl ester carboxylesterase
MSISNIVNATSAPLTPAELPDWVNPALYPFTPKRLAFSEGTMSYLDEGTGSPVLMVHGTPTWSFEWREVVVALRGEARCVVPDHLGFGLSDKPNDPAVLRPSSHADRLQALVQKLDLRDITLVVHDFGGPIGIALALAMPERIRSLVVLNSWMWAHGDDRRIARMSKLVASAFGRFLYLRLNASPRWLIPMALGKTHQLDKEVHRHYLAPLGSRAERTAPWVLGCELAGSDPFYASLWDRRATLERWPMSLVWGTSDPAFGTSYLERWQAAFPSARSRELEGVGHFPPEEAPAQVIDEIRRQLGLR